MTSMIKERKYNILFSQHFTSKWNDHRRIAVPVWEKFIEDGFNDKDLDRLKKTITYMLLSVMKYSGEKDFYVQIFYINKSENIIKIQLDYSINKSDYRYLELLKNVIQQVNSCLTNERSYFDMMGNNSEIGFDTYVLLRRATNGAKIIIEESKELKDGVSIQISFKLY